MTPFQTMVAYLSLGASPLAAVMIVMADIEGWAAQVIGLFILTGLAGTTYLRIRDDERAGGTSSARLFQAPIRSGGSEPAVTPVRRRAEAKRKRGQK